MTDIIETSKTLNQLVKYLIEERKTPDIVFKDIILTNHPVFGLLKTITRTSYRIYFTNIEEMDKWLQSRRWNIFDDLDDGDYLMFVNSEFKKDALTILNVHKNLFDENGQLKVFNPEEWKGMEIAYAEELSTDDEIPF